MAFELFPHPVDVQDQIDALPPEARTDVDGAPAFILAGPFDSPPSLRSRPEGLRRRGFGLVVYQVRFDDAVQVELVQRLG